MSSMHLDLTTGLWMAFRTTKKSMWECYFQMAAEQKKPEAFPSRCESVKPCLLGWADVRGRQMGTWSSTFCRLASDGKESIIRFVLMSLLHLASNFLVPIGISWWETLVEEDKSYHRKPLLPSAPWEHELPSLRYGGSWNHTIGHL